MVHQNNSNSLFSEPAVDRLLQKRAKKIRREVENLRVDDFQESTDEQLAEVLIERYTPDVPVLLKDDITIANRGACKVTKRQFGEEIKVDGRYVEYEVPFSGESKWFTYRPSRYKTTFPRASVKSNALWLRFESTESPDSQSFDDVFESTLERIEEALSNVREDVDRWVNEQTNSIRSLVQRRRDNELGAESVAQGSKYELKERKGSPSTYKLPKKRRPVSVDSSTENDSEDVRLADDDYEHILRVMRHMAWVMEKSPSAFTSLDEEDLRFHFLVQLNGQFEGQAVGEAFNYQGKTDILINHRGRNLFVAECKFWDGAKRLSETIDQLLGYTCWRDTKVAIVLFNKNKNFTNVLKQIEPTVEDHSNYIRTIKRDEETEFGFVLRHPDDPERHIRMTVMAFDVPSP